MSKWIVFIYGVLLFVGGMIGFAKVHSVASLVMGTAFSIAIFVATYLMFKGKDIGNTIAIGCSGILMIFFAYRFTLSFKFMPAGLMCLLSIIVLGSLIRKK